MALGCPLSRPDEPAVVVILSAHNTGIHTRYSYLDEVCARHRLCDYFTMSAHV